MYRSAPRGIFYEFAAREAAGIADTLDHGIQDLQTDPMDREPLTAILRRQRALLGSALSTLAVGLLGTRYDPRQLLLAAAGLVTALVWSSLLGVGWDDVERSIARDMRERNAGRILITGSIAGFMPGTYQAVYNGTKAMLDSFSFALRHELRDTGVTVTSLISNPLCGRNCGNWRMPLP